MLYEPNTEYDDYSGWYDHERKYKQFFKHFFSERLCESIFGIMLMYYFEIRVRHSYPNERFGLIIFVFFILKY